MPLARPTVVIGLDLVHDSDVGTQAFARHVGEHLTVERARLVVAGMRGVLEDKADLIAEALQAFPDLDLTAITTGPDLVAALAAGAGLTRQQITEAQAAAALDLARSAWTVGPAPGLAELRQAVIAHHRQLAVLAPTPVGVPEILDAIEMPDLPWVVVPPSQQAQWWRDAVRPSSPQGGRTAEPEPGPVRRLSPPSAADHLVIADRPAELVAPATAGVRTALIDRFGRARPARHGTHATWSAVDLTSLLPTIAPWLEGR